MSQKMGDTETNIWFFGLLTLVVFALFKGDQLAIMLLCLLGPIFLVRWFYKS